MNRCQIRFKHNGETDLLIKSMLDCSTEIYVLNRNTEVVCSLVIETLSITNPKEHKYAFSGIIYANTIKTPWAVCGNIEPQKGVLNSKKELIFLLFRNVTSQIEYCENI